MYAVRESEYLAGKVDFRYSDAFQDFLGNGNSLYFIGIGVCVVYLSLLVIPCLVQMTRLDDDATKGEDIASTLVSWVDSGGFVAEVNDGRPVLQ